MTECHTAPRNDIWFGYLELKHSDLWKGVEEQCLDTEQRLLQQLIAFGLHLLFDEVYHLGVVDKIPFGIVILGAQIDDDPLGAFPFKIEQSDDGIECERFDMDLHLYFALLFFDKADDIGDMLVEDHECDHPDRCMGVDIGHIGIAYIGGDDEGCQSDQRGE